MDLNLALLSDCFATQWLMNYGGQAGVFAKMFCDAVATEHTSYSKVALQMHYCTTVIEKHILVLYKMIWSYI